MIEKKGVDNFFFTNSERNPDWKRIKNLPYISQEISGTVFSLKYKVFCAKLFDADMLST